MTSDGEKECEEKEFNVRMSITKKGHEGGGDKERWGSEKKKNVKKYTYTNHEKNSYID